MYPKVIKTINIKNHLFEFNPKEMEHDQGGWHFATTDELSFGPWTDWWEAHKMLSMFIFVEMDGHTLRYLNPDKTLKYASLKKRPYPKEYSEDLQKAVDIIEGNI